MDTAGGLDAFLDAGIEFSSVYGVSAGSCHACSYLSKQRGRAFRVNVDYLDDPNYCGAKTFLKTGNVFGPEMLYEQIPDELDPFDFQTFFFQANKGYKVTKILYEIEVVYGEGSRAGLIYFHTKRGTDTFVSGPSFRILYRLRSVLYAMFAPA